MAGLYGEPPMPPSTTPPPHAPMATCEETYGIFPCSTSLGGSIILIVVYGQALLIGQPTLRPRWPPAHSSPNGWVWPSILRG
jgi:hypothetical protein